MLQVFTSSSLLLETCSKENWNWKLEVDGCDITFKTECNELIYPDLGFVNRAKSFLGVSSSQDIISEDLTYIVAAAELDYSPQDDVYDGSAYLDFVGGQYTVGSLSPSGLTLNLHVVQPETPELRESIAAFPGLYTLVASFRNSHCRRFWLLGCCQLVQRPTRTNASRSRPERHRR